MTRQHTATRFCCYDHARGALLYAWHNPGVDMRTGPGSHVSLSLAVPLSLWCELIKISMELLRRTVRQNAVVQINLLNCIHIFNIVHSVDSTYILSVSTRFSLCRRGSTRLVVGISMTVLGDLRSITSATRWRGRRKWKVEGGVLSTNVVE